METMWFCAVALLFAVYVVLDGCDLGAGIVHLGVARTSGERRQVLRAIGPAWDRNEVWLLAAGCILYFAFPALYSASFHGFRRLLLIVLGALVLRGISIGFRGRDGSERWKPIWDVTFMGSSALLAIVLGAALGNVVRGVPLDPSGNFFLPLWTNFAIGPELGILDWYTTLVGLLAYVTLTQHGALWLAMRTTGLVAGRARIIAAEAWWPVAILTAAVTAATLRAQLLLWANLESHRWGFVFPALAIAGLIGARRWRASQGKLAFGASAAYIAGMLSSALFGIYPNVLPSTGGLGPSLTIHNAAAPVYGMQTGVAWLILGMILAAAYFVFQYRHMARHAVEH